MLPPHFNRGESSRDEGTQSPENRRPIPFGVRYKGIYRLTAESGWD
jgi:hypothetical protein